MLTIRAHKAKDAGTLDDRLYDGRIVYCTVIMLEITTISTRWHNGNDSMIALNAQWHGRIAVAMKIQY